MHAENFDTQVYGTTSVDRSTFARIPFGRGRLWLDYNFGSIWYHWIDIGIVCTAGLWTRRYFNPLSIALLCELIFFIKNHLLNNYER